MIVDIEVRPDGVFLAGTDVAVSCQWYALCDRDAVTVVAHPILGQVPTCQRCADRAAR